MVNAKLHIICGNCGDSSMLELEIRRNFSHMKDDTFEDEAIISCRNCATRHFLSSVLPKAQLKGKPND